MYNNKEFNDMAKRDKDMTLYSQSNVIASYISMIKFAIEKIELYVDEIGDEVFFDLDESIFPPDVLGDDSLFEGYTNPWSPEDRCDCRECRYGEYDPKHDEPDEREMDEFGAFYSPTAKGPKLCMCDACWDEAEVKPGRMSTGSIMDMLKKTRKVPQDYRMD